MFNSKYKYNILKTDGWEGIAKRFLTYLLTALIFIGVVAYFVIEPALSIAITIVVGVAVTIMLGLMWIMDCL